MNYCNTSFESDAVYDTIRASCVYGHLPDPQDLDSNGIHVYSNVPQARPRASVVSDVYLELASDHGQARTSDAYLQVYPSHSANDMYASGVQATVDPLPLFASPEIARSNSNDAVPFQVHDLRLQTASTPAPDTRLDAMNVDYMTVKDDISNIQSSQRTPLPKKPEVKERSRLRDTEAKSFYRYLLSKRKLRYRVIADFICFVFLFPLSIVLVVLTAQLYSNESDDWVSKILLPSFTAFVLLLILVWYSFSACFYSTQRKTFRRSSPKASLIIAVEPPSIAPKPSTVPKPSLNIDPHKLCEVDDIELITAISKLNKLDVIHHTVSEWRATATEAPNPYYDERYELANNSFLQKQLAKNDASISPPNTDNPKVHFSASVCCRSKTDSFDTPESDNRSIRSWKSAKPQDSFNKSQLSGLRFGKQQPGGFYRHEQDPMSLFSPAASCGLETTEHP